MTELLVSVRSVEEAHAALRGGPGLIDVKEPRHGSLGRATDQVITAVREFVGDRCPVSAAMGELLEATRPVTIDPGKGDAVGGGTGVSPVRTSGTPVPPTVRRLSYVKWGLAGCVDDRNWRDRLHAAGQRMRETVPMCQPVAVAYADRETARAPAPAEVCAFACEHRWGAFLLDTWQKNGGTLLDYLSIDAIGRLVNICHERDVRVALAGSLSAREIGKLQFLRPDWFAVRRAVCVGGSRTGVIDSDRVRELAMMLKASIRES